MQSYNVERGVLGQSASVRSRGAAHGHPPVLISSPVLSITLMGLAYNFIARIIHRYRWIAYVGLLVILYVSVEMTYENYREVR